MSTRKQRPRKQCPTDILEEKLEATLGVLRDFPKIQIGKFFVRTGETSTRDSEGGMGNFGDSLTCLHVQEGGRLAIAIELEALARVIRNTEVDLEGSAVIVVLRRRGS